MTSSPRIALITGANRGIGRSTALALARDGVDVILTYRSHADEAAAVVDEIASLGRKAVALQLDTGATETFDAFVASVTGTLRDTWRAGDLRRPHQQRRHADRQAVRRLHRGRLRPARRDHVQGRLLPHAEARRPGRRQRRSIINISTGLTRFYGPDHIVYAASKGAVEVFTRYLAHDLGERGITVNTIAPGPVATDFSGGLLRDNEPVQQMITSLTALGRTAVADDIGSAIAALVGAGNRWVTGQRARGLGRHQPMTSLKDKTALVTGSARGIGRAIAERYAALGANVVVNYATGQGPALNTVSSIEQAGGTALAIQANVAHAEDVDRLFESTLERFGSLDIVVANAGVELLAPRPHRQPRREAPHRAGWDTAPPAAMCTSG